MAFLKKRLALNTKKQFELIDVTSMVKDVVKESGIQNGMVLVYNPHTTAAIRLTHNEPLLAQDIMKTLYRMVPVDVNYSHDVFEMREHVAVNERSNGHAHVKSFILGASETIPLEGGNMGLGAMQSIFFVELDGGRARDFDVVIVGA